MNKYKKVYYDIRDKIKNGDLKPGDYLKKEQDIAEEYSISRLTIRKSLSILEAEGYIQKLKGKKSIVLEKRNLKDISLNSIQTFQEINKRKNINIQSNVISLYIIQGVQELMDKFQVSEEADFYKLVRTYSLDKEILEYSVSYFDRRIVPFLNVAIAKKSTYEYLENKLKLKISYSRREIKFRNITPEEIHYMDLKENDKVVVIETHAYLSNGTLFQYEITAYNPDKVTFTAIAKR